MLEEQVGNMPDTFLKTGTGELYILNGIDKAICWDGLKSQAAIASVEAATARPTIEGAGIGVLSGKYFCYIRFIDADGSPSNLSPLSLPVTLSSKSGLILDVSSTTPVVLESTAHGLATGQTVSVSGVGGIVSINGIFTVDVIDGDFFILNDSSNDGQDYTGGGSWFAGVQRVVYKNVQIPNDPRIVKRQILRNTNGQTEVFFVDLETTDLTSTVFFSTLTDELLSDKEDVPLYDSNMNQIANGFPEIPNWKPFAASVNDRVFYAGSISYSQGSAKVANGNALVYGIGTDWKTTFAGRRFFTGSSIKPSIVSSVDEGNQIITLIEPFIGKSSPYSAYTISPPYLEKKALYYSEVGQPKKVRTTSGLVLQEEQDEIVGLVNLDTFLLIFCKSKLFRLTFGNSPDTDGSIYPASYTRGAINQKCIVVRGSAAVTLDRLGVYAYSEGKEETLSTKITSIFEGTNKYYSINWKYSDYFHAIHILSKSTIRWFVVMGSGRYPRHAICYNYKTDAWWIEEFSTPIMSSCQDFDLSSPTCFLGTNNNRILRYPFGNLDGLDSSTSIVSGTITASSKLWIEDSNVNFDSIGCVNNPIGLRTASGKSIYRVVKKAQGNRIYFDRPLVENLDPSKYTLGSMPWVFRTGNFRIDGNDKNIVRNIEFNFQPTLLPSLFNVRFYRDRLNENLIFKKPYRKQSNDEFYVSDDGVNLIGDFSKELGALGQRFDTHRESSIDGAKYISIEVDGLSTDSQETIYGIRLDGVFHAPVDPDKQE